MKFYSELEDEVQLLELGVNPASSVTSAFESRGGSAEIGLYRKCASDCEKTEIVHWWIFNEEVIEFENSECTDIHILSSCGVLETNMLVRCA